MTASLESRLKDQAHCLGFELVGIAQATDADHFHRYQEWLARGYAGEMHYLHKHATARAHPQAILTNVRSVVMLGMAYPTDQLSTAVQIAKYALVPDYHRFLWDKLNALRSWLLSEYPDSAAHGVTDTAPLLERDFARRAGLGWFGKNTMLINKQHGSFLFLAALLTSLDLVPDAPHTNSHCGTCTACLDACPTVAFAGPGWLDARRCISYLTIELKGAIPVDQRAGVGGWLFGCDVCQDVCPWNRRAQSATPMQTQTDLLAIDPVEILQLTPAQFKQRFQGTSLMRTKWRGLLRNAAIVLGNRGDPQAIPVLEQAAQTDDAIVREACQWALRQLQERTYNPNAAAADLATDGH